jgi:hypothetical protein
MTTAKISKINPQSIKFSHFIFISFSVRILPNTRVVLLVVYIR